MKKKKKKNNSRKKKIIFKKSRSKNSTNIDLLKLINFLGKVINIKFNAKKIDNNKLKDLSLNNHPKWDSLAHVKLLSALEKKFKISINETNIDEFSNIKSIFNFLSKKGKLS